MILVTGAAGQIGSELVGELRARFGSENVVAGKHRTPLPEAMELAGPSALVDVTNRQELDTTIKNYGIKTVFHMSSILSALAEQNVETAHEVNINGVFNLFQVSLENDVEQLVIPSSIAAFGPDTPKTNTPNDTIQKPNTVYGISKVCTELMGNYYQQKFDLDVRGSR